MAKFNGLRQRHIYRSATDSKFYQWNHLNCEQWVQLATILQMPRAEMGDLGIMESSVWVFDGKRTCQIDLFADFFDYSYIWRNHTNKLDMFLCAAGSCPSVPRGKRDHCNCHSVLSLTIHRLFVHSRAFFIHRIIISIIIVYLCGFIYIAHDKNKRSLRSAHSIMLKEPCINTRCFDAETERMAPQNEKVMLFMCESEMFIIL